jgi:hypothetical protein
VRARYVVFRGRPASLLAALLGVAALTLSVSPGPAHAASGCSKVASPSGSDSATGSESAPYRSVQQLVDSLSPGQTGCLRQGTYGGDQVFMHQPDVTLRSYPGERATITAFFEVYPEAKRARVERLRFESAHNGNAVGVKLQADDTVFADNELTKGGEGICLLAASYTSARRIVIERNRIYNCGPSDSKWDHQVYLGQSRDAVVRWNILSGNGGGWGVHLYGDADGTLIEHNVIDGNRGGVIFAGDDPDTSDNNTARYNAITYSGPRWNIEGSWGDGPVGTGNTAHHNCVHSNGPDSPSGIAEEWGFNASSNTVLGGSPYADRARGDYRIRSDSPCAWLVGDVAAVVGSGITPAAVAPGVGARVAFRIRRSRRVRPLQRVRLTGRLIGTRPAASTKVALQLRKHGRWHTRKVRRLRPSGRFSLKFRTSGSRRRRVVRVRALVPGVGKSGVLRLRVRP